MASIRQDKRSGNWIIKFAFAGETYCRSCRSKRKPDATRVKSTVEETLHMLNTGRLTMPHVADPGRWIISGGKLNDRPHNGKPKLSRLGEVCDAYFKDQLDKADTTLNGESIHLRHLKRLLGTQTKLRALDLEGMQEYTNKRRKEDNRMGGKVSGKTIRKELTTFMQIWDWARQRKYVSSTCPFKDCDRPRKWAVKIPKPEERQRFMTWEEIERRIGRGGLEQPQEKELWKRLFLDEAELKALLEFVEQKAAYPFIYPMFAFAAYTGARRSEILRSLVDDFNFEQEIVTIRERKRRKDRAATTRDLPLNPRLGEILSNWRDNHPGGQFTIAPPLTMPHRKDRLGYQALSAYEAHYHFEKTLRSSKWIAIPGFHVLRHSFGAICTRKGIPMNVTAKWMGHTTEEMMTHYQHLFQTDEQNWMGGFQL